jgi:hypothetical protein
MFEGVKEVLGCEPSRVALIAKRRAIDGKLAGLADDDPRISALGAELDEARDLFQRRQGAYDAALMARRKAELTLRSERNQIDGELRKHMPEKVKQLSAAILRKENEFCDYPFVCLRTINGRHESCREWVKRAAKTFRELAVRADELIFCDSDKLDQEIEAILRACPEAAMAVYERE